MGNTFISPAIIRGEVIESNLLEFGGRGGDISFLAPDPAQLIDRLPLASPGQMQDLYELSFEDILDFLQELGGQLAFDKNPWIQQAFEQSLQTAPTTEPIMRGFYTHMPAMFDKERIRRWCNMSIPIEYLEGWVEKQVEQTQVAIRAYGSRALHIIAGNGPVLGALTLIRGAITRSDTIIKVPSNDPFTTAAIARTMCDFAPDHPITKHLAVAYWRGGDEALEKKLYQPHNIEKIVAWGGFASVKHVTKYIQPGLELISLDPKNSASIVGADALSSPALRSETASRIAADVGAVNQTACSSCRVVYVMCGTDDAGIAALKQLGEDVYAALLELPEDFSTTPKAYDPELKSHVDGLRLMDDWYDIIGGERGEGAVIVSHMPEAVDFRDYLADRTVNLVPVDTLDEVLGAVDAYTQTVGVFPDSLMEQVRHKAALYGGQRFVSLGYAFNGPGLVGPQDGIEPLRRMCKWIVTEQPLPSLKPVWERKAGETSLVA
ncbi:acyl-CoA reductase [Haliea sp. E17]|uniref:acyl-CoA reductase n=1 Tax=Haliea sp. E17 TaxID=3401576 RepID=UPI003AAF70CA